MLTIRLDEETEKDIEVATKRLGVSKSDFIRKSISEYLKTIKKPSFFDVANKTNDFLIDEDVNFSENSEEILRNKFKK